MQFAKECWPFVLPFGALAAALIVTGHSRWAVVSALLALILLLFFRIPPRPDAGSVAGVLAPANGKILRIDVAEDADVGPGTYHRIIIFLSVFNVHVQRAPVAGAVVASRYTPGRKLAAFDARAGNVNERLLTVLERDNGDLVGIRQIAGLLARRVVTYLATGQKVAKGQLIGVIKFGSRVDLSIPVSYHLLVKVGDTLTEGRTVVARRKVEQP